MLTQRSGLIVWVNDLKPAKNLERFGSIHYMSKKMHYVVMYIHADKLDETVRNIQKLPYVKKVERSYRNEIKTEYSRNVPDKTRSYTV
ncbi:YlbG family protein [Paenibacillus sp. MBLB4367]|uniref:YlbG family protein n=1 Tax=Paenibacillus sp. MBLB4367 TaxID=3384767 RepID=UPI0039082B8F